MNNVKHILAQSIESYIDTFHKDWEHQNDTFGKDYWVEVQDPVPHQFPLNSVNRDRYPLLPISFEWVAESLVKIKRYNSAFDYSVGQHVLSGYNFIGNLPHESAFGSKTNQVLTGLGFLLHDVEETLIGDIISPVERALGLNLNVFKTFIRLRLINRILLGLHNNPSLGDLYHFQMVYAAFFPYQDTYVTAAYPNIPMDILGVIYEVSQEVLNLKDAALFDLFTKQLHELVRPESVKESIDKVDYLCFVGEAKHFGTTGQEAWRCAATEWSIGDLKLTELPHQGYESEDLLRTLPLYECFVKVNRLFDDADQHQRGDEYMNPIEAIARVWDEDTWQTMDDRIDTIYDLIDHRLINGEFCLLDEILAKLGDLPNLAERPQLGLAVLIATNTANSEISNKQAFITSFERQLEEAFGKDRSQRLLFGLKG